MDENKMSQVTKSRLSQPLKIGNLELKQRVVMSPLTRLRADKNHVQLPFTTKYYCQRASNEGTLLIAEATLVSLHAGEFANSPGIWSQEQITAWRKITDAVHARGSHIFLQLWAPGRVTDPYSTASSKDKASTNNGNLVGPSAIAAGSDQPVPHELTDVEIQTIINDYAQAASNAVHKAGFDGVEILAGNGYLLDQFLQDVSNQRTDRYGGSIANRSRFVLEVASAVKDAVGAERVGVRINPFSPFQGMGMTDPVPQFTHVVGELARLNLAYLHIVEARGDTNDRHSYQPERIRFAIEAWNANLPPSSRGPGSGHPVLLAGGYTPEKAAVAVDETYAGRDVAIVFGRYFLSTPDLVYRVKNGLELNQYDRSTFYKHMSQEGYADYPFSKEFLQHNRAFASLIPADLVK